MAVPGVYLDIVPDRRQVSWLLPGDLIDCRSFSASNLVALMPAALWCRPTSLAVNNDYAGPYSGLALVVAQLGQNDVLVLCDLGCYWIRVNDVMLLDRHHPHRLGRS